MKDWFRDNLRYADNLIGSYDDRDDQYNLTLETKDHNLTPKAYTVSYTEKSRGWVSFKSFIQQDGISHKNIYYTVPSNKYSKLGSALDPWGEPYGVNAIDRAELWQHSLDLKLKRLISQTEASPGNTIKVEDGAGVIFKHMYVEGDGIPIDTTVVSAVCDGTNCDITLSNDINDIATHTEVTFTSSRNTFYNKEHYSMLKVLFNGDKGTVKRFKTLDYEGSQAKTTVDLVNTYQIEGSVVGSVYYDNYAKKGWYVENIRTDMQDGEVPEFIDKENKWFNSIIGLDQVESNDNLDTGEFSLQGLGNASSSVTLSGAATPENGDK